MWIQRPVDDLICKNQWKPPHRWHQQEEGETHASWRMPEETCSEKCRFECKRVRGQQAKVLGDVFHKPMVASVGFLDWLEKFQLAPAGALLMCSDDPNRHG